MSFQKNGIHRKKRPVRVPATGRFQAPAGPALNRKTRACIVGATLLALFLGAMDALIISAAMPTITAGLGVALFYVVQLEPCQIKNMHYGQIMLMVISGT